MHHVFFRTRAFLKHFINARNQYGLHSPFLYQLYVVCFGKRTTSIPEIEHLRKKLLEDNSRIAIKDFKTGQTREMAVKQLARASSSSTAFSGLLLRMANYLQAQTILETGTLFGLNTLYLSHSRANKVVSLEGNHSLKEKAEKHFQKLNKHHIEIIEGNIFDTFEATVRKYHPDFLFLDAHHHSRAMEFYHQVMVSHTKPKAIIYHDIHWSPDTAQSWKKIRQDPTYCLTAETFDAGFIFPHIKAEKQHFILKF